MNQSPVLPVTLFAVLCGLLPAQEDAAAKKPADPAIPPLLAKLKEAVADKKMEREAEVTEVINTLHEKAKKGDLNDKDRKDVAKALGGVFTGGKLRLPDAMQIYLQAGFALGELGAEGGKELKTAYDNDRRFDKKKEWLPLREHLLRHLGRTKDTAQVKFLCETARREPEAKLMAAAGEALGNFEEADQKIRKDIVDNLLIRYGELHSRASVIDPADIEAQNARDYLATISQKWNSTLGKMTGQNHTKFTDWQTWYQKNKDKDWKN